MTQSKYQTSVERLISAPPEKIFDVLARPARHLEIDGAASMQRLKSGPDRLSLGASFDMKMGNKFRYSTRNTVVEFEENRRIAWQTFSTIKLLSRWGGGRIWRYELEPQEGGTLVRETWDVSTEVGKGKDGLHQQDRVRNYMINAMTTTLERLDKLVSSERTGA